jgi:hypothetical protein
MTFRLFKKKIKDKFEILRRLFENKPIEKVLGKRGRKLNEKQ